MFGLLLFIAAGFLSLSSAPVVGLNIGVEGIDATVSVVRF